MHRHGYQGRKFGRERDQRRALLKGLATQLVEHGSITTTLPKAKDVRPYTEKLITKAKKGGLANRRIVMANLATEKSAHKLFEEIAPALANRDSGYLRITKKGTRRGDLAPMATLSFVDDLTKPEPVEEKPAVEKKPKPVAKKTTTTKKKDDSK